MSPDRDLATTSQPSRQDLATVPGQPQIEPSEMYPGGPFVLEVLAARARAVAAKAALAELTVQSIGCLADVRYIPGSGELPDISSGSRLDVRFLADRVVFAPAESPRILAEFGYPDVAAVEVG